LTPAAAAKIGLRILEALCAAHAAGIVHRDVKPSNVLLEGDRVVLTDFGIAALEDDVTLTRSGLILGTPAYMAPEQARGLRATEKSDLWSLGATLYAAVEGDPPFRGPNSGAVFMALASEAPAPPVKAGPLSPVIGGLLDKDPARRLSADVTAQLLRRIVDGSPATWFDPSAGPANGVPPGYRHTGPPPGWATPPPAQPVSTWPAGGGRRWPEARQQLPFPQAQRYPPDERLRRQAAFMPLLMFFCAPIGIPWGTVIAVKMYRRGDRGGRFWVLSVLLAVAYLWLLTGSLVSLANSS
jgi:fructose-specific component phosphotransferase system IIB-like protein